MTTDDDAHDAARVAFTSLLSIALGTTGQPDDPARILHDKLQAAHQASEERRAALRAIRRQQRELAQQDLADAADRLAQLGGTTTPSTTTDAGASNDAPAPRDEFAALLHQRLGIPTTDPQE
jgi:hypothetical protein